MRIILTDATGMEGEGIVPGSLGRVQARLLHEPDFFWVLFDGQQTPVVVAQSQIEAWQ